MKLYATLRGMKRLGLLVCTVLFAISMFGVFYTTKAEAAWQACGPGLVYDLATDGCIPDSSPINGNTVSPDLAPIVAGTGLQNPPGAPPSPPKPVGNEDCGFFNPVACAYDVWVWLVKTIGVNVAGIFLWISANIFDTAIRVGVLDFKNWAPDALYPLWLMIRQVVSLLVVFIGLYLGFLYIIGKDGFQKYIPWVVMFALFVNFSYPIVRSAIDISNVVSLNIYASVVGPGALDPQSENTGGALIVSKLGLKGLVVGASKSGTSGLLDSIDTVPSALLAIAYVLYAAYIFAMAAILFMLRTAALVFLIVASPLLLIDSVFPVLGEKAKKLREILFAQLAVGPIFMIMFALTVRFLDIFDKSKALATAQFGSTTGNNTISSFFSILMMLILLWIMLKVTKAASGSLGQYVSSAVGTVGSYAAGAATGGVMAGTGMLARKGLGGLAAKARDSKWVTNNQDGFIGRRAYNLSNAVASSTFDMRNTAVAQKFGAKLGISSGMGGGTKLGYDEEEKKRLEARTKEALARSARIKTHHERDVYKDKTDDTGKAVYEEVDDGKGGKIKRKVQELVHKKGDVNAEGWEAKNKLMAATGGATFFMTKEQKQKIKEAMAKDEEERADKRIAENKAKSNSDVEAYKSIGIPVTLPDGTVQTVKESKARFLADLNTELDVLRKTDPTEQGNQTQTLINSINAIKKTEATEKAAFDKQVKDAFNNYNRKSGKDQEDYFTNQTDEIQNAINDLKENALGNDRERDQARNQVETSGLDLDLSGPDSSRRDSALNAARNLSAQVQTVLADKPQNGAVPINAPNVDIPLESNEIPAAQKFDVSQVNFAAVKRIARQASATQVARQEMAGNSGGMTTQVAGTQTPSANAQAPSTPAANQPNVNRDEAVAA